VIVNVFTQYGDRNHKTPPDEPSERPVYSQLGPGGGRTGSRDEIPEKTNYAEAKDSTHENIET